MSRPSTPLRRISRGSLSALSLSQSHAAASDPLAHLQPLLAEVGDAVDTLADNFAALHTVNESLNAFNENFASFLYGLKANAYTCDFTEGPTQLNFDLEAQRRAAQPSTASEADLILSQLAHQQQQQSQDGQQSLGEGSEMGDLDDDGASTLMGPDTTLGSHYAPTAAGESTARGANGRRVGGSNSSSSNNPRTRPTTKTTASSRQKLKAWIEDTLQHCPLEFRQPGDARTEMERILVILRDHPQGIAVADVVKKSRPPLASHRVNAALIALTRSKQVIRSNSNGLTYRLDPEKHPL